MKGLICSRCGRSTSDVSGAFVLEKIPNEDMVMGGICMECHEEVYFGGWFMDQYTDEERNEFIKRRVERYGN